MLCMFCWKISVKSTLHLCETEDSAKLIRNLKEFVFSKVAKTLVFKKRVTQKNKWNNKNMKV